MPLATLMAENVFDGLDYQLVCDPGTSITPINVNRTAGPSNIQVFGGPAVTSDGTRIMYSLVPAGHKDSSSGGDSFSGMILAQDTDYVFKVTNTGNNTATVSYNFEWIEEPV